MSLNIEFTPREEEWLSVQAAQSGLKPADIVRKLVDEQLPPINDSQDADPTLALFAQCDDEDAMNMGVPTSDFIISTTNPDHLAQFVPCELWTNIEP